MDTKARPSRPRDNDDREVIVVDTITEPADDADTAWPESPGLNVEEDEEPREYIFEVAEEDHAEKEKKDDDGEKNEEEDVGDEAQDEAEAVENQVEDTEEGGDVGEDEKKEADPMMEADTDDERGAITSMRREQAKAQKRDPVMHLDSQGVFQVCKLGLKYQSKL